MNLRVLAIALPYSGTDLLWAALEALGLPGEALQPHELFTTAADFYFNAAGDNNLKEDTPAYQALAAVKPGRYLPGYFFYSKAGARLLAEMSFKKIIMVRDPRDMAVYQLLAGEESASPWNPYLQKLPDTFSRLQACLNGFTHLQSGLAGVSKESLYKQFSYYLPWTIEPDTLVVRYEDLICAADNSKDTAAGSGSGSEIINLDTLARISGWLGLTRSDAELRASAARLADQAASNHQTHVKVGTWRSYFMAELLPVYRKTTGSLLRKFGYEEDSRWFLPQVTNRVALISQPKAGTHLLDKALRELGLQPTFGLTNGDMEQAVISDRALHNLFRSLQPGEYFTSHLHYNKQLAKLLNGQGYKKILIIRDPRDVVISLVRYACTVPYYWTDYFLGLADDDTRFLEGIRGVLPIGLLSVSEILNGIVAWLKEPECLLVRFEDLVGANGQGDTTRQIQTLQAICRHLEIELDYQQLAEVAGRIFDRNAVTFREGQIGTWQRYFKPVHHQALNKRLGDSIEQFGYKKYEEEEAAAARRLLCAYPVLAVTGPGTGTYLLDLVLDEIGLGRQQPLLKWPYPAASLPPQKTPIALDRIIWSSNSAETVEELLEEVKNNQYLLGYIPFSEAWADSAAQKGFKKIVLVRDRRDAVVALALQLSNSSPWLNPPVYNYFRSLPDDTARLWTAIRGISPAQGGNPAVFLAGNQEFSDCLDKWSNLPDTLVVSYESLVGAAGGGSDTEQRVTIEAICHYLGIEISQISLANIVERLNRRLNPLVTEGHIGQWKEHLTRDQIQALIPGGTNMEFTGERYIPSEGGQIKYEHLHRYALCEELVRNKIVLDIASGEGYGAAILAKSARRVIGADLDLSSVQTSRQRYSGQSNLDFVAGSCAAVPLRSHSVDVVTSFETIEHHHEHLKMLTELKRVLKPDGVLIISSPNRAVYSNAANYSNPYHVRELYFEELDSLLKSFFKQVSYYGQRIASGSMVFPLEETPAARTLNAYSGGVTGLANKVAALREPVYFIAVCMDPVLASPERLNLNSLYLDKDDELENQWKLHIALLQKELSDCQANLSIYAAEFENQQRSLEILQAGHTVHTGEIHRLTAVNTGLNEKLALLEASSEQERAQFQAAQTKRDAEQQALQKTLAHTTEKLAKLENSRSFRLAGYISAKLANLHRRLHF